MVSLLIIFVLLVICIILYYEYKIPKLKKDYENKIIQLKNKIEIKEFPNYIKHYDNHYHNIYKIKDIRILQQNPIYRPELCAIITGVDKDGNKLNATIDKFIEASAKEFNNNKRNELNI